MQRRDWLFTSIWELSYEESALHDWLKCHAGGGFVRVYLTNGSLINSSAISISLFAIVMTSVLTGTALPFGLAKLGVDPANAGTSIQVENLCPVYNEWLLYDKSDLSIIIFIYLVAAQLPQRQMRKTRYVLYVTDACTSDHLLSQSKVLNEHPAKAVRRIPIADSNVYQTPCDLLTHSFLLFCRSSWTS